MRKIIIDCDPGQDDAIALLLATRADNIKILGVTTVEGNCSLRLTTKNALQVLNFAGVFDIPVYPGCDNPNQFGKDPQQEEIGLGGVSLPASSQRAQDKHAVDYLIEELLANEDKINIVALGPLTNIALALEKAPEIKAKIQSLIIMGGAIFVPGNITSTAEFNIYLDPSAAQRVFQSGCDIYLNTLDISMKAVFTVADIQNLARKSDKISKFVAQLLDKYSYAHVDYFGFPACPVHDALCVAALIDERLISYKKVYCDISLVEDETLGAVVVDTQRRPNVHISTDIDIPKFIHMITEHLGRPYRNHGNNLHLLDL